MNHGIEVLASASWIFHQNNMSEGGLIGQVTKCRYKGHIFYTRENVTGVNSFEISSGERWGDKAGATPSRSRQSLEVLADKSMLDEIMDAVRLADTMKRRVKSTRNFTMEFIKQIKGWRPPITIQSELFGEITYPNNDNEIYGDKEKK